MELVFVETPDPQEKMAKLREADYTLCSWTTVPSSVIEAAPRLKLIQKYGIGVDKIDLVAAAQRGVPVAIAAGVNAVAVAETAITLMLAVYKRLSGSAWPTTPCVTGNGSSGNCALIAMSCGGRRWGSSGEETSVVP